MLGRRVRSYEGEAEDDECQVQLWGLEAKIRTVKSIGDKLERQQVSLAGCRDYSRDSVREAVGRALELSLIHISEPTRLGMISYAVFCLKKKKKTKKKQYKLEK